jgi:hypothetical protein
MASVLTVLTAVCVTGAFAVGASHANECQPFVVSVHLQVNRSITSRVITADLRDEANDLWKPYGVRLEWTDSRASAAAPDHFSVDAVLDRQIDGRDLPTWATVLGLTSLMLDGRSARPIRVSLDATQHLLAYRSLSRAAVVNEHDLGRALGRVLAHEIGHVLLGAPHDEVGLMRAGFRPDELAESDRAPFRLTCTGVGRLRSRISRLTGIEPEPIDLETCLPGRAGR